MSELKFEELYEIHLKEKQEELVEVNENFYRDIDNLIMSKKCILDKDGLTPDERTIVEDEIRTIKKIKDNLFERRLYKIVLEAVQYSRNYEDNCLVVKPRVSGIELELFDSIVKLCRETKKRLIP